MNPNVTLKEFGALLRDDLFAFIHQSFMQLNSGTQFQPNWHIDVIASALEDCLLGDTKRLIINVPPRSLKSHCASIALPAFWLGHKPHEQVICVSYGQDLASKLAIDSRSIMQSAWYRFMFRTRLSTNKQAINDFHTTNGGYRLATSIEGALTGRGADVIIIDDPLKPEDAMNDIARKKVNSWFDSTLASRLNSQKDGVIIIVMQRLHLDDLVAHVQKQGPWKVLSFPAIATEDQEFTYRLPLRPEIVAVRRRKEDVLHPDRESAETLEKIHARVGDYIFAGQYQQAPVPPGGGMIKKAWIRNYENRSRNYDLVFQSWDTATKVDQLNDYSVCTTWGLAGGKLHLLNVFRERLIFPDLKAAVRRLYDQLQADIVIVEDTGSGSALIQQLEYEGMAGVEGWQPTQDKVTRMYGQTSRIQRGDVLLPLEAPWLASYTEELLNFPYGKHDDQVDSTSQALCWINARENGNTITVMSLGG